MGRVMMGKPQRWGQELLLVCSPRIPSGCTLDVRALDPLNTSPSAGEAACTVRLAPQLLDAKLCKPACPHRECTSSHGALGIYSLFKRGYSSLQRSVPRVVNVVELLTQC